MLSIKNTYLFIFLTLLLVSGQQKLWSQCMPSPQLCNKNECDFDEVNIEVEAVGNNFVCEGEEAIVTIDKAASLDFDYFIYYWCDGVVDTLTFDDQPAKHRYTINPEDRCNNSQDDYFIQVVGYKECGDKVSCRTGGVSLSIIYKPVAAFNAPDEVCIDTEASFSDASCNTDEDRYFWDFGDGNTSTEVNPTHIYESTGNYTVRLTVNNDCGENTTTRVVQVVGEPKADFDFTTNPENSCKPAVVDFDAQTNQWSNLTWEIAPFDTLKWCFTEENMNLGTEDISVLFKQAGKYPVTLTASNICPEDDVKVDTIEIFERPTFSIVSPGVFCKPTSITPSDLNLNFSGTIDKFIWTFENGSPSSYEEEDFPEVNFQQSGTITLTIESPCEVMSPQTVPITIASFETINLSGNSATICQNAESIQLNATPTGGQWITNGLPNGALTELGLLDPSKLSTRNYTLTYSTGTMECPNEAELDIEILEGISVSLEEVEVSCESVTINFGNLVDYEGDIEDYLWTFPDGTTATQRIPPTRAFSEAGTFPLIVAVSGECGQNISDTILVDVQANEDLVIEPINNPLCTGSAPDTLRVNTSGGKWQGQLIVDADLGIYDPSSVSPGRYEISYVLENGACSAEAMTSIEVVASESVTIMDRTVCTDSPSFVLEASTEGGVFTGMGVDSVNGTFDPMSVIPDEYMVSYNFDDENGCAVEGKGTITVEDFPQLTFQPSIDLCISDFEVDLQEVTALDINPTGGQISFMGTGITDSEKGTFNAANLTEGTYKILLQYARNECKVADTLTINLVQASPLVLSPDTTICLSQETFQLMTNLSGGTWRGNGVDELGIIDLNRIGEGTFDYNYEFGAGTSCAQSGSVQVTIVDPQSIPITITDKVVCTDSPLFDLEASRVGGIFTGLGVDSINGTFDPLSVESAEYIVSYTLADESGCIIESKGTILVEDFPQLNFQPTIELCVSDFHVDLKEVATLDINPTGGQLAFVGEGIIDTEGGIFNAANLSEGTYKIALAYTRNECFVEDTLTINLVQARPLMLSPDTIICIAEEILLLATNLSGGTWIGMGINEIGTIDLNVIGGGIFNYDYSFGTGTSCAQSGSVTVEVIDPQSLIDAGADTEICEGPASYTLQGASPPNGQWEGVGISTTGTIDLSILKTDTFYTYTYCIESDQIAGCGACATRQFKVNAKPTADFTLEGTACINQSFELENNTTIAEQFAWDFGDGTNSSETSPMHEYNQQGNYLITLIGTTSFNCKDTSSLDVYVTTPPTASFTLNNEEGCAPFTVSVNNNSFGDGISQQWLVAGDTINGSVLADAVIDSITTDSLFTIILQVENSCGTVWDSAKALVHPYPIVGFGISQDEDCSPAEIEFFNAVLGNPDNFAWDMGNGATFSTFEPPNQVYTTSDTAISTYTIQLQASNECGMGMQEKTVTVFPPNVEAFIELDTLKGCQPLTVELKGFATPRATTNWEILDPLGNAMGSELNQTVVELNTPGVHTLIYYASNCGTHTDTALVEVLPASEVTFTHRPFICEGEALFFENLSDNIKGTHWDFGDGDTSNLFAPTHIYDATGIYTIRLMGFSGDNNCPATFESEVRVIGNPTAQFTPSTTTVCPNETIAFTNESEGQQPLIYNWDFGDGSSNSAEPNPVHRFTQSGRFEVTLQVTDQDSCFSSISVVDIFVNPVPVVDFRFPNQPYCHGYDTLFLENLSTNANQFIWTFDADTSRLKAPFFIPENAGTFTIGLAAENEFGCQGSSQKTADILPSPIADFIPDQTEGCQELLVQMDNRSQNADGYIWNFDQEEASTDENPSHLFKNDGNIPVTLIATALNGCPSDTLSTIINIWEKPIADFRLQKTTICGTPTNVIFENLSPLNLDYQWSFGDGQQSSERNPTHQYDFAGEKMINLIVTNEFSCRDTMQQMVDIFGQPVADVLISTPIGCEDLLASFTNLSEASLTYEWNISGFPTIREVSPTLTFTEVGSYDLELIAIYNETCTDTLRLTDVVQVYQSPIADFRYEADLDKNVLGDVTFYNNSFDADHFEWDLGDGTTTTQKELEHIYDLNRSIPVTLVAFNDNGGVFTCTDSITKPVDPEWITTFYAPNAFAPDLAIDKVDVFQPVGIGIQSYNIDIYSPYGKLVWHSTAIEDNQPTEAWNGQLFNTGEPLPQGVYVWKVELVYEDGNEKRKVGTVNLLR